MLNGLTAYSGKKLKEQKFLCILLANLVLFIGSVYLLPIRFEENDDVAMLLFASGAYSGTPEPHLVFINYLLGLFLAWLYAGSGLIEWYTSIFFILHVLSISVIVWTIIKDKNVRCLRTALFLCLFYIIEVRLLLQFQFTTTAAVLALAGIVLIRQAKNNNRFIGALVFVLAGMIRFEAAILVLLIVSPLFLSSSNRESRTFFSKSVMYATVSLVVLIAVKFVDHLIYQRDQDWAYYQQYNKLRGQINDNPNVKKIEPEKEAGIPMNEFALLLDFFPDAKVLDLTRLTKLSNALRKIDMTDKLSNIGNALNMYKRSLFLLTIIGCIVLIGAISKENKVILLSSIIIFYFSLCFVSLDGSLKSRVYLAALLPLFYVLYHCSSGKMYWRLKYLFTSSLLLYLSIFLIKTYELQLTGRKRELVFQQQENLVHNFYQNHKENLVLYGGDMNLEFISPFSVSSRFKERKLFLSGWVTASPMNKGHYESYMDLVGKNAIFFLKSTYQQMLPKIKMSIKENYGIDVKDELLVESQDYIIVRLKQ